MKKLRRHWRTVAVTLIAIAAGGGVWVFDAAEGRALMQDPPGYTAIDLMERDAIRNLMGEVGLDREAMIALNPTANQAEALVSAVRNWYEDNVSTLNSRNLTIHRKVSAVRKIEKAIRMGPAQAGRDTELAVARQELGDARAAHTSGLSSLETAIERQLSQSQEVTWSAIRGGHGRRMPIRMLNLSDAQRLAVSKAQRTYRRQRNAARTDNARSSARTARASAMDSIFTSDQKNVVEAYHGYMVTASAAVGDALNTVLEVSDQG